MARGGRGRGGYQRPSNPAAVSGPGKFSQRTDGGPGAGTYEYSGLPYGDNQAVNSVADGAPMGRPGGGPPAPAGRGSSPRVRMGPEGVFGPTERPAEPLTAGVDWGPGPGASVPPAMLPDDPDMILRAIVASGDYHPDLVRLLARG